MVRIINQNEMHNYSNDTAAIETGLSNYFKGIYEGDVELLRSVFHFQALVAGDVNGQPYFKTVDQYLDGVKNRKSPAELNEPFSMQVLSIEIINSIAIAKARVSIFEFNYNDLLSLHKMNGKWVIMNKLLTNVKE